MAYAAVDIVCPGCGAPVRSDMETCVYCQRPVVITSFAATSSMPALDIGKYLRSYEKELAKNPGDPVINKAMGLCYIARGNYERALCSFESAIDNNPDDADAYYFASVAMLQGKKPFLAKRDTVDKVCEYLQTSAQIGAEQDLKETGIVYYFLAYVLFDYFERKKLKVAPSYKEYLARAAMGGVTSSDADSLHAILKTPRPAELN